MVGGTFITTIQAPPERVWAVVADLGTHASWSPKAYTMEWTGGEPNQVGSRFHSVGWVPGNKHNENEVEITERVEPKRFAFNAKDPQGVFVNEWELRPAGDGGTEVAYTLTFPKMHGVVAVAAPILFPLTGKRDIRARMTKLKQTVESRA
ncbi:MAG: SRPBCC family protein [Actinomycetota bacterium]